MRDYLADRSKDLDLVIARPGDSPTSSEGETFRSLVGKYDIQLSDEDSETLLSLPNLQVAPVGSTLIAMEAKAVMTAHVKALPRLYDELSSSHQCIHGESDSALAIAYVQVNAASTFISSNPDNVRAIASGERPEVSLHRQPTDSERVLEKLGALRRRVDKTGVGFDAIGVSMLDIQNDGTEVTVHAGQPSPSPGDAFHYSSMIMRMATRYDTTFSNI